MIKPEKLSNALYAIHFILVRARFLAYQEESTKNIACILDYVEELPRFIATDLDMTDEFRESLKALVEQFPICSHALKQFDESGTLENWEMISKSNSSQS